MLFFYYCKKKQTVWTEHKYTIWAIRGEYAKSTSSENHLIWKTDLKVLGKTAGYLIKPSQVSFHNTDLINFTKTSCLMSADCMVRTTIEPLVPMQFSTQE